MHHFHSLPTFFFFFLLFFGEIYIYHLTSSTPQLQPQPQNVSMETMWSLIFSSAVPTTTPTSADQMPAPYNTLLPPNHHMTQTLEGYFKQPVQLNVIATRKSADLSSYSRAITLSVSHPHPRNVQLAVVKVVLENFDEAPRAEILSEKVPLGRTLKSFGIKTQVDVYRVVKIEAGNEELEKHIKLPTYGRLGLIYCNEKPGIYLLEILSGDFNNAETVL